MEDLDFTISPHLSDLLDEEDEELEQSRREQNEKEWIVVCWIAGKYICIMKNTYSKNLVVYLSITSIYLFKRYYKEMKLVVMKIFG